MTADDLARLAQDLTRALLAAGERPNVDLSLDYCLMIDATGWNLQVKIPHIPVGYSDTTLPGGVQFHGKVTPSAWVALDLVRTW